MDKIDGFMVGLSVVCLLLIGLALGIYGYEDDINSHCKKYGKHVTDKWTLTCEKNKGE